MVYANSGRYRPEFFLPKKSDRVILVRDYGRSTAMHRSTIVAWSLFALLACVIPAPYGAPRTECFEATGNAPSKTFVAVVDGRPFFASYTRRVDALAHAQRIGACVENFGIRVEHVHPLHKWALRFKKQDGYAVFGTHVPRAPNDYFRLMWKDRKSGEVHHSEWYRQGLRVAEVVTDVDNRVIYKDDYIFWIEIAL